MKENVITSILQHDFIFFALSEKIEQSYFCKLLKNVLKELGKIMKIN